jgi:hypothetical protein
MSLLDNDGIDSTDPGSLEQLESFRRLSPDGLSADWRSVVTKVSTLSTSAFILCVSMNTVEGEMGVASFLVHYF